MIDALIGFALRQRILVAVVSCLLILGGLYTLRVMPIDAFPDVTNVQVQILTEAPGLSPVEVEKLVTFPIELVLTGLPGLDEIRSLSKFGLSQITVVFHDNVDIYFARQLVLERMISAKEGLPEGVQPEMAPVSTGLGEVYQYYLARPGEASAKGDLARKTAQMTEERTLQDWVIRPLLKGLPGVIDVNSLGGYVKQYNVIVDPVKLRKYELTIPQIYEAIGMNNANAGGGVLERPADRYIVRSVGMIKTIEDLQDIVVKEQHGTPVFVRDVAEVAIGHAVRHGAAVLNGEREVVVGVVLMLRGANALDVVKHVKQRVADLEQSHVLPTGIHIVPFYDRSELVDAALKTVSKALVEGIAFVVIVLFLFLGNVRSALIVVATLIVAPLGTFIIMNQFGLSANLMSLGGLAIAIGMLVDGSVVMVENIYRLLSDHRHRGVSKPALILEAAREVSRPVVFGIIIIVIVFLPLISLEGMEGKLFAPMAYTIMIALLVSLVVSLTLSPLLCLWVLRAGSEEDTFPVRWAKRVYLPTLEWALSHPKSIMLGAAGPLLGSLLLVPFLGGEFIPILEEGSLTPQVFRLPDISLDNSIRIEMETQKALREFPEILSNVSKLGRSEIALEPMELNESDQIVSLKPRDQWTTAHSKEELVDLMRQRLAQIPGITLLMSQPIQEKVDELISGTKSEIAVKLFGDDLEILTEKAGEIAAILATIDGVRDIKVEQQAGQSYLTIDIDRRKIARFGINVSDIQQVIETAIGGKPATRILEGERRFAVAVRFPEQTRNSPEAIGNVLIESMSGSLIPLSELGTVTVREGPAQISREHGRRRIYVGLNVVGRDIQSVVEEGQQKLAAHLRLPTGYIIEWGGAFENMQRAMSRLAVIVPITIGLIFFLLFSSFNSLRHAGLIIANLPFSLIGGIVALWATGQYLSVPASVGFIALFGVAALNGIVLVSYMNKLRDENMLLRLAITSACILRLRPVLMTALVALLGLLPLAFASGIGSEVQRPLATVVIGGLVSSTLLTLIVLPVLYQWMETRAAAQRPSVIIMPGH
ncbi:MAG: CusA/CzcA family heavy metal efflux RND transporter [Nitrospirota bacterium]